MVVMAALCIYRTCPFFRSFNCFLFSFYWLKERSAFYLYPLGCLHRDNLCLSHLKGFNHFETLELTIPVWFRCAALLAAEKDVLIWKKYINCFVVFTLLRSREKKNKKFAAGCLQPVDKKLKNISSCSANIPYSVLLQVVSYFFIYFVSQVRYIRWIIHTKRNFTPERGNNYC